MLPGNGRTLRINALAVALLTALYGCASAPTVKTPVAQDTAPEIVAPSTTEPEEERTMPAEAEQSAASTPAAPETTIPAEIVSEESALSYTLPDDQVKPVVYQVFTRLFGNQNTRNKPWGTIEENGVGKFSDFTDTALDAIHQLGVSHIWYTGVPHHAVIRDYTRFGISNDDPDVVKGRAGSPYAVKDYYNVDPDLADDPANRLSEFEALIERTHAHGMKVIIDIVPNHVARAYKSVSAPEGTKDFGEGDDTRLVYAKDNNFYYVPGVKFKVPAHPDGYKPLGGEAHPLADGKFKESPAKWTGNGARVPQPDANDWYETVKINYGVLPDGTFDFPVLPEGFEDKGVAAHMAYWSSKDLPDSWYKVRDIAYYWLDKGVDGFRYDMAEMVPVEFWSFLNASIKMRAPDSFLLAEVYQPDLYRDYLHKGKMDYLYDKVDFYDSLKRVMQGRAATTPLEEIQQQYSDIAGQLLHFLENHDEQRIASPEFAGDAKKGMPALVVSALISRSPMMIYFGQEVGEDGSEETGFGDPSRTTIFDYAGVPAHQRWMNAGKFDGGALFEDEAALRRYYADVLNIAARHPAMKGSYMSLHTPSLENNSAYDDQLFAFTRYTPKAKLIVVSNFSALPKEGVKVTVPDSLITTWKFSGNIPALDLLSGEETVLSAQPGDAGITFNLGPMESKIYAVRP